MSLDGLEANLAICPHGQHHSTYTVIVEYEPVFKAQRDQQHKEDAP